MMNSTMKSALVLVIITGFTFISKAQTAPDYSRLSSWASHPDKNDLGDSIAPFIKNEKREEQADVFYLHPTTHTKDFGNASMNASIDDQKVIDNTDPRPLLFQATAFNNVCRVFAPRYRQAHLKAYIAPFSEQSKAAFDMAYQDLKKAFEYYLANYNKGRPIVIAAHSQGSMHAVRLLQEFFDGKSLQKQLVCAYIVGWRIKKEDFTSLKVGTTPDATGCFVGWRSYKEGESDYMVNQEKGNSVCVNPVTWTTSNASSEKKEHKGAIGRDMSRLMKGVIKAQIDPERNILWVDLPDIAENMVGKMKNYHVADYNLFYMDIRENVRLRVETYLKKQ